MKEQDIQKKIREKLEIAGWLVNKIISCTNNGWPDIEAKRKGITIHIEVKKPGKTPTDLQLYRHKQLRDHGFVVVVADKVDDILFLCL